MRAVTSTDFGPPRRRWRFRLRTFLVVLTLFSFWLAYEANWIHRRGKVLDDPRIESIYEETPMVISPKQSVLLWLSGEPDRVFLMFTFPPRPGGELTTEEHVEIERVQRLFPEVQVGWYEPGE